MKPISVGTAGNVFGMMIDTHLLWPYTSNKAGFLFINILYKKGPGGLYHYI